MHPVLRTPDELYQRELGRVICPQFAQRTLRDTLHTHAFRYPGFRAHLLEFLSRQYRARPHQVEDAFQLLQDDLEEGRVLLLENMPMVRAYQWIPGQGEDEQGQWAVPSYVFAEHRPQLQRVLATAKADVPSANLEGATESSLEKAFNNAKGAAKQFANDLMRRNEALKAEWFAEQGAFTFTDKNTGQTLSPDEVKQRWEAEGSDVLPIADNEQAGAQAAKEAPAMGAAMMVAQTAASRGRNIIQHPDNIGKDIAKALQNLRGPKDKQLSEALGKIGGEQAKRRQGMETDPRYVDRYHGPDDMARDPDGKLVELEYKGNKTDSTSVARDNDNNRQGSSAKNKRRSVKMTGDKAKKVELPSDRQGGPYTEDEIELWQEVLKDKGDKRHISVHTNTETGQVRTFERDEEGNVESLLDEFTIENFDSVKSALKDLLK